MDVLIRKALEGELAWVNARYAEVRFVPSNIQNELIAIAEVDSQKAGMGRLVKINDDCFELGGMLVLESFRGLGLAKHIVEFLLAQTSGKQIFCIPFAHLFELYHGAGFNRCEDLDSVPKLILEKYQWCQQYYEQDVLLLQCHPSNQPETRNQSTS